MQWGILGGKCGMEGYHAQDQGELSGSGACHILTPLPLGFLDLHQVKGWHGSENAREDSWVRGNISSNSKENRLCDLAGPAQFNIGLPIK